MSGTSPTAADPSGAAQGRTRPAGPTSSGLLTRRRGAQRGDAAFRGTAVGAAVFLLALMGAIAAFLVTQALHAITADHVNFLTAFEWSPDEDPSVWGVALVAWGTLVTSLFGLVIGAPVAIGAALFITQYAPRRLAQVLGYIVDLLAAVPSVVYGLWGIIFLVPHMGGVSKLVDDVLGWIPILSYDGSPAPARCSLPASCWQS